MTAALPRGKRGLSIASPAPVLPCCGPIVAAGAARQARARGKPRGRLNGGCCRSHIREAPRLGYDCRIFEGRREGPAVGHGLSTGARVASRLHRATGGPRSIGRARGGNGGPAFATAKPTRRGETGQRAGEGITALRYSLACGTPSQLQWETRWTGSISRSPRSWASAYRR